MFTDEDPEAVRLTLRNDMENETLQIAKTVLDYLNVTLLIVDMNLDMVIPLQHTPNPSAHVPSLVPPMFEHSALSNKISSL